MPDAFQDLIAERLRQDEKWGEQNHDPFTWLPILIEEIGEFSEAALDARFGMSPEKGGTERPAAHLRKEAIHVAAVGLAIVECLDRGKWQWPSDPRIREEPRC